MKTLKSNSKNVLATLIGKAVYISDLRGNIQKQFAADHFKSEGFDEEVKFPGDFFKAKELYHKKAEEKAEEKRKRMEDKKIRAHEERKRKVMLLWNLRKKIFNDGICKIYTVFVENTPIDDKAESYTISFDVFIDLESAKKQYKELLSEAKPDFGYDMNFYLSEGNLDDDALNETQYEGLLNYIVGNSEVCPFEGNIKEDTVRSEYKSIDGAILVEWKWVKHIGYARNFIGLREGHYGETEADIYDSEDKVWHPYTSALLSAEELSGLTECEREKRIAKALSPDNWKWTDESIYTIKDFYGIDLEK